MKLTVACPEALIDDANSLAMVLAFSEADAMTYRGLNWQDADGNLYASASFEARPEWVIGAQSTLVRPEWDVEPYAVNMTGAERAQAALMFWAGPGDEPDAPVPVPQADPARLTVVAGMEGLAALAAMGLTRVPEETI